VGFAIHNTTEGLAIVSPLTGRPVSLTALAGLGLVAGVPTIFGAWAGGFAASPWLALVMLAVGVGAIAAVVVEIDRAWSGALRRGAGMAGIAAGFAFMYVTGLLVVV
ncbi:MAG TPA: divalent cation transporter, partial [Candidatus Thermoplasmatota archaeon]|nr:divalent cation transporter [Candidatus Thermoplasmatota archaeon]